MIQTRKIPRAAGKQNPPDNRFGGFSALSHHEDTLPLWSSMTFYRFSGAALEFFHCTALLFEKDMAVPAARCSGGQGNSCLLLMGVLPFLFDFTKASPSIAPTCAAVGLEEKSFFSMWGNFCCQRKIVCGNIFHIRFFSFHLYFAGAPSSSKSGIISQKRVHLVEAMAKSSLVEIIWDHDLYIPAAMRRTDPVGRILRVYFLRRHAA